MAKERKRKRRIRIAGVLRLVIIVALLVFFVIKLIDWNHQDKNLTYTLEYAEVNVVGEYPALILRDETLITASSSGKLTQVADDGKRVKVNERIMDVTGVSSEEMAEQGTTVATMEAANNLQITKEQRDKVIEDLKAEIAALVRAGDFDKVDSLSAALEMKINTRSRMAQELQSAESMALGSEVLGEGESTQLVTTEAGILTYYIDGYEDVLSYGNIANLNLSELLANELEAYMPASHYVNRGDVVAKLINDNEYYLLIIAEPNEYNRFDVYQDIIVDIDGREISGTIENFIASDDKVGIAILVDEYVDDFYKRRKINVKIKQETYQGLSVEKSSIMKTEDGFGVYVVDKLDRIHFKPIKIIQYYDEQAIVKSDFYYTFIGDEKQKIETVSIYDRVIRQPDDYEPGDVLN